MTEQFSGPTFPGRPQPSMQPMFIVGYHVEHGPMVMYATDARQAAASFPDQWSLEPWPGAEKAEAAALVQIPPNWRFLSFPQKRALAIQLGAPPSINLNTADPFIAAEYTRRVEEAKKAEQARKAEDAAPPQQPDPSERRPRR